MLCNYRKLYGTNSSIIAITPCIHTKMAAPSKKNAASASDDLEDDLFLAVVIADSYDRNLDPCSIHKHRVIKNDSAFFATVC